jgi:CRP-like cAMP-binding protein
MRKALYLMGVLEDTDIEWIAQKGEQQRAHSDTVLIREGHSIGSLYILLDGQVTVSGAGRMLASLSPGEIFGEISFVDSRLPMATVTAAKDSRLLAVSRDALQDKLGKDPWFASRFYKAIALFLADRLRTTSSHLGYGNPSQDSSDSEIDELDSGFMDCVSLAGLRFDKLQKKMRGLPAVAIAGAGD